MAYDAPTAADLKLRHPAFAGVADAVVNDALDQAAGRVGTNWPETDFATARILYAAHVMTLDGHGAGTEATQNAKGLGGFQTVRSGSLMLQQFDRSEADERMGEYGSTSYGRRFWHLMARCFAGPVVI